MNTKHTPGPWYRACGSPHLGGTVQIVTMNESTGYPDGLVATANAIKINPTQTVSDEVNANARLIASSPRLLAALEALLDQADLGEIHDDETRAVVDEARLAVAEAKGLAR